MKLLLCLNCSDVIKLDLEERKCKCGETKGKYLDNINAVYSGETAIRLGIDNRSLSLSLLLENKGKRGVRFESFLIPENCDTFVKEK